jgi:hypothetical protein
VNSIRVIDNLPTFVPFRIPSRYVVFVRTTYKPTGESHFGLLAMNSTATAALGAAALDSIGIAALERKAEERRKVKSNFIHIESFVYYMLCGK